MSKNNNIAVGRVGMNRDSHPSNLTEQEYTIAYNSNIIDEAGNGVMLQREHSNILCTKIKEGYFVIGFRKDLNAGETFYFLTNPETGCSEIGTIRDNGTFTSEADIFKNCDCDFKNILSTPLEDQDQIPYCTYTTLITDCCDTGAGVSCLNFSIDHPIRNGNINIKEESCGKTLYWTDNFNPPRYINLSDLDDLKFVGEKGCEDRPRTCLDCERLRIFPKFNKPCLKPETIQYGGNLRKGIYEFMIAYSDSQGNELSEYYSLVNPISLFDTDSVNIDQTELADKTDLSIKLSVEGLDNRFTHYKIVVIQVADVNQTTSYFVEGVHPIGDDTILYTTDTDKERTDLNTILKTKPVYTRSEIMANSNGFLFQAGLTSKRDINLQPVVSLLGSFLKWGTVRATENLYKDGVASSEFRTYFRDEVYPFAIRFFDKEGYPTPLFPLINRPPSDQEISRVDTESLEYQSIENNSAYCASDDRDKFWQFYNTATTEPRSFYDCEVEGSDENTSIVFQQSQQVCVVPDVVNLPSQELTINYQENFTTLANFISQNREAICDPQSDFYNLDLCNILQTVVEENCNPTTANGFDTPEGTDSNNECEIVGIIEEYLVLNSEQSEIVSLNRLDIGGYEFDPNTIKIGCSPYVLDSGGAPVRDEDFENNFMDLDQNPERIVYLRNLEINQECQDATPLPLDGFSYKPFNINYTGGLTLSSIQTTKEASTDNFFYSDKVHKGASWHTIDVSEDFAIIEISQYTFSDVIDNVSGGVRLRYTFFDDCNTDTNLGGGEISIFGGGFIEIDTSVFSTDTAYIVFDAPYVQYDRIIENGNPDITETVFITTPYSRCLHARQITTVIDTMTINTGDLSFDKRQVYNLNCPVTVYNESDCEVVPDRFGKFGYVESLKRYPCNDELYDSSNLVISPEDITTSRDARAQFELYYVQEVGENYVLSTEANFTDRPIRHYRFPDSKVAPFMNSENRASFAESTIFPMGVHLDNEVVNNFLDIAVKNNLLTQEERDSLVKYEILRGDRTQDRGIIAKGLSYDLKKYTYDDTTAYSPNYPYNDLGLDRFIESPSNNTFDLLNSSTFNNKFTFHSPDTHFRKPVITGEVKIEGYQFGDSRGRFEDVKGHPKFVVLGASAFTLATTLATAELLFNVSSGNAQITSNSLAGGAAGLIIQAAANLLFSTQASAKLRFQWIDTMRNLGKLENFASYYASEGFYNTLIPNYSEGNILRGLKDGKYLKAGNFRIRNDEEDFEINNLGRESSLFLNLGNDFVFNYPFGYFTYDNTNVNSSTSSRFPLSSTGNCTDRDGSTQEYVRNIASPYMSIKQFLPEQYGVINSVRWLTTGYCGDLSSDNNCDIAYGGDVFISRFSLKRKMPFFLNNAMGLADDTPFDYKQYGNIKPKYFLNYQTPDAPQGFLDFLFPSFRSQYVLDCKDEGIYVKPPSKFYLFNYGIPRFLVESEINCNFRHAGKSREDDFYPNESDYMEWTQEENVSIQQDNTYYYNSIYSKNQTRLGYRTLPDNYSREKFDCLNYSPNSIIASQPDNSEVDLFDPWLSYKALDTYTFPTSSGKLKDILNIESNQLLARFENQFMIFNAIDTLRDRLDVTNNTIGNGGIFSTRPLEFKRTELGYAGTQHKAIVSCEFGHFWVDSKRGQVIQVDQNGRNFKEITQGLSQWFKENLPFKLLNSNIENFTDNDIDNNFKSLGISMGWDSRFKRVFLTKKDYEALIPMFYREGRFYSSEERDSTIATFASQSLTYQGMEGDDLVFTAPNGIKTIKTLEQLSLRDSRYFNYCAFTLAYSPMTEKWISYYSFLPDYYVSHQDYFQTGLNFGDKKGLWSHLITNKSFNVFYGELKPWLIEVPIKQLYTNKVIESVEYWLDSKRYHNDFDFSENRRVGFDKAWIYNNSNNSGELKLITRQDGNMFQETQYPRVVNNSTEILATQEEMNWSFNDFFNRVRNELNNVPIWLSDCNNIDKRVNTPALNYNTSWNDRLRGDWFLLRLSQQTDSQHQQVFKWTNIKENIYNA